MTAGIASRHMYSIASWSPSQSEPLTVSNICQRQSSLAMLPSAALMPPCAATVWLRVGNTFVTQAVLSPAVTMPSVARNPAPPAPSTTTSKEWSIMSYALGMISSLATEEELEDSQNAGAGQQYCGAAHQK